MLIETLASPHPRECVQTARAVGFLVAGVTSQQGRQAGHRDVVVAGVCFVRASLGIIQQNERDSLAPVIIAHTERPAYYNTTERRALFDLCSIETPSNGSKR